MARFATSDNFASYTGTAPIEASSGDVVRHRLSRAGNRRLNSALHVVALSNKRHDPRGQGLLRTQARRRQRHQGRDALPETTPVRRRLPPLVADRAATNPGGQMGATLTSSAADQIPTANTSDKPQPGFRPDPTPAQLPSEAAS